MELKQQSGKHWLKTPSSLYPNLILIQTWLIPAVADTMHIFAFALQRGKYLVLVKMATCTSDIIKSFEIRIHFSNKWWEVCSFILQIEKLVFLKHNNYKKNLEKLILCFFKTCFNCRKCMCLLSANKEKIRAHCPEQSNQNIYLSFDVVLNLFPKHFVNWKW